MERTDTIDSILKSLPLQPGVYKFLDSSGTLIYVGKARNLKRRVTSYFTKNHPDAKTRIMVRKIADIRIIVVDKESDALLLENSMIKEHKPRYNIMMKDDKTFPWICIRNEHFPRVVITRQVIKDGSKYFGPFTSAYIVRTLMDLVRKLFQVRTCNLNLDPQLIRKGRYAQPCLEYHIGNCLAPCIGLQTVEEYEATIQKIIQIIKGNLNEISDFLKKEMTGYSHDLQFEKAQLMKDKITMIEKFQAKSVVVNPGLDNIDVLTFINDTDTVFVNFLKVQRGSIIQSHNLLLKKYIDEPIVEIMSSVILDIRQREISTSPEIIMQLHPLFLPPGVRVHIPRKGDKLKLIELSKRNAQEFKNETKAREQNTFYGTGKDRLMNKVMADLKLPSLPSLIECFDNSNLQGTNPVAACVVFRNGRPARSEYRMFNVKSVQGPDDYASMKEVIYRRYKRQLEENGKLPQLIIVDGGKGQLSSALKALEMLGLTGKFSVIGIAKRLEEIYFPHDSVPLYLDKNSETLKLIQRIRDEAHRFGINFHRKKRSSAFIQTELTSIKGIGETIASKLLQKYKSVLMIREVSQDELSSTIGNAKALLVYRYFHPDAG